MRISDWSSDVCSADLPAAEKPLVGATDVRDDRRFGEARGDAAILRAADQREALAQVARQRIGARDPQRIFARGRLAPRAVINGKTARGAAFGIDVVIIAAEDRKSTRLNSSH